PTRINRVCRGERPAAVRGVAGPAPQGFGHGPAGRAPAQAREPTDAERTVNVSTVRWSTSWPSPGWVSGTATTPSWERTVGETRSGTNRSPAGGISHGRVVPGRVARATTAALPNPDSWSEPHHTCHPASTARSWAR